MLNARAIISFVADIPELHWYLYTFLPPNFIGLDTISFLAQMKCEHGFLLSLYLDTKNVHINICTNYSGLKGKKNNLLEPHKN